METPDKARASQLYTLEETQRAVLNILEDTNEEQKYAVDTQKAVINILEDYSTEKILAEQTQKAVINILEDYSVEKAIVENTNLQLTRSNNEIEQFAYITSHDLQEPLRTITNYVELFQKQYENLFDEDAKKYMTFINKATSRMQTLIKDLQDYSRIGKEKEKTPVDCNILLKDVLYEMEPAISESNASIRLDNLPIIKGYYLGIKCLFQNLISNAIKFRKKGTFPIINIGVIIKSNEWLFTIKDNGIGIDKKYYKKLFVIFQRLHNKEEYQGTGIGLAQTKKIIDLHGGRIWIESETGTGCTFNFTIPKYQNT